MMSDETTLADLLALDLHKVENEVRNIVDKASKELSMEKTLKVCYVPSQAGFFQGEAWGSIYPPQSGPPLELAGL